MDLFELFMKTINFICFVPFTENKVFPSLIGIIFIWNLVLSIGANMSHYSEYKKNKKRLIYEDYQDPITSSSTPGILMSIGIIGTFYLIYASLNGLDENIAIQAMLNVIKTNIAPAFSISAFGISASILYTAIEKTFITTYYKKKMSSLAKNGDEILTYSTIELKQLETLSNVLDSIRDQTNTFKSLNNFANGLNSMTESMQKFGEVAEKLESTLNPKVLGEVISTALLNNISPVLNDIQTINNNVNDNSNRIKQFLENELKNEIMIPLKNSVDNTSSSMQQIEKALIQTSNAMIETNKGFDKLNSSLDKLDNVQDNFVHKLNDVLSKQKLEFENTTQKISDTYQYLSTSVAEQTSIFNQNSKDITQAFSDLSKEMQEFLLGYKNDYKELLENQEKAIEKTTSCAIETLNGSQMVLKNAGDEASNVILRASTQIENTLKGVDDALVKTSSNIKAELEKFKDSYTDSLKGFLNSQEEILNSVFKEQTVRLAEVVNSFKMNLETDVANRKVLNEDLEKLVKTTNGFVSQTQLIITTTFDKQQQQLIDFFEKNQSMQTLLTNMINNATSINEKGNESTKDLIETIANLSQQFNDNQIEILKKYQTEVDEHLKTILSYMAAIIEASHMSSDK